MTKKSEKEQYSIAICALLHDVGKFKQRAFGGDEKQYLSKEAKDMEGLLLPPAQGGSYYSHRHALWTYDFFLKDFIPIIKEGKLPYDLEWEAIASQSAAHHNASVNDDWSGVIAKADRASAGMDRKLGERMDRGDYLKSPLRPIFGNISLEKKGNAPTKAEYAYSLSPLSPRSIFPKKEGYSFDYRNLWEKFVKALQSLKEADTYLKLLTKLKDLLYEYTWCIPSATNDYYNDISLYDHSVTTMALALALYCAEDKGKPIRLVGIGISGIQSFLFQSKHEGFKNAARIFRGRSFIISAYTTAFRLTLCKKIGVIPFVDCIDAGGKLTLMLPNYEGITNDIEEYLKEVETFLLKEFLATLSVTSDYLLSCSIEDFTDKREAFKELMYALGKNLDGEKFKRFKRAVASESLDEDFVIRDFDITKERCKACGKRSAASSDEDTLCELCENEKKLGERLTKKDLVSFSDKNGIFELLPSFYVSVGDAERGKDILIYSQDEEIGDYPAWRLNSFVPEASEFGEIAEKSVGRKYLAYVKYNFPNQLDYTA